MPSRCTMSRQSTSESARSLIGMRPRWLTIGRTSGSSENSHPCSSGWPSNCPIEAKPDLKRQPFCRRRSNLRGIYRDIALWPAGQQYHKLVEGWSGDRRIELQRRCRHGCRRSHCGTSVATARAGQRHPRNGSGEFDSARHSQSRMLSTSGVLRSTPISGVNVHAEWNACCNSSPAFWNDLLRFGMLHWARRIGERNYGVPERQYPQLENTSC